MGELALRLTDLLQQWTKGCKMMEEICDVLVKEHLQSSLPTDVRIHVSEKKKDVCRNGGACRQLSKYTKVGQ